MSRVHATVVALGGVYEQFVAKVQRRAFQDGGDSDKYLLQFPVVAYLGFAVARATCSLLTEQINCFDDQLDDFFHHHVNKLSFAYASAWRQWAVHKICYLNALPASVESLIWSYSE